MLVQTQSMTKKNVSPNFFKNFKPLKVKIVGRKASPRIYCKENFVKNMKRKEKPKRLKLMDLIMIYIDLITVQNICACDTKIRIRHPH